MRFDIHVHTSFSGCSHASLDDIIDRARTIGLDGICITDHHTMEAGFHIKDAPANNRPVIIVGMEYTTLGGDFLIFGPFNSIQPGLSAEQLLHTVNEAEGIAIAAHPMRIERPVDQSIFENRLCTVIEAANGRNTPEENSAAESLLEKFNINGVGGSDAHTPRELGSALTIFHETILSADDLISALRSGNYNYTNIHDHIPGPLTGRIYL